MQGKAASFFVAEWGNHRVCEWDIATGLFKKVMHLPSLRFPTCLSMSPDEKLLAVSDWGNHQVILLNTLGGSCLRIIKGVSNSLATENFIHPVCVSFAPDGRHIAVGDLIHFKVVIIECFAPDGLHDSDDMSLCVQTVDLGTSAGQTLCSIAFDPCNCGVIFIHQGDVVRAIYLDHPSVLYKSDFALGPGASTECSAVGIAIDAKSGRIAIAERCAATFSRVHILYS